jgi:hypothetical protein
VIPVGHVQGDDRDRHRIGAEVIPYQGPERRLLLGFRRECTPDELREQLSELVDAPVHLPLT